MSVESIILQTFDETSPGNNVTQKDIIKRVKKTQQQMSEKNDSKTDDGDDVASSSAFNKKAVKKLLRKLVKSGTIALVAGETKVYCRWPTELASSVSKPNRTAIILKSCAISGDSNSSSNSKEESNKKNEKPLPFAESLRRRKKGRAPQEEPAKEYKEEKEEDIDDEIRRLEAELAADSDSSGDSGDDDNCDDDEEEGVGDRRNPGEAGVISLSMLATDRITALPETFLPTNKRRTLKIDKMVAGEVSSDEPKAKRRKKSSDTKNGGNSNISDGLRAAVKQVLDGYTPRSNEKIPFYCRVCAKQYKNGDDFFDHKKGDFHKAAVELEKKASYCKLCRKQLTSPVQLKEHLYSKPHKERLQLMKSRQPPRKR